MMFNGNKKYNELNKDIPGKRGIEMTYPAQKIGSLIRIKVR